MSNDILNGMCNAYYGTQGTEWSTKYHNDQMRDVLLWLAYKIENDIDAAALDAARKIFRSTDSYSQAIAAALRALVDE